jgi:hypothetical protein
MVIFDSTLRQSVIGVGSIWISHDRGAIRRGTFRSGKELAEKICHSVRAYNSHTRAFTLTAPADSIFAKIQRLFESIYCGTAQ